MKLACVIVAVAASTAAAQDFQIWLNAPNSVMAGDTYTIEVWGGVSGGSWVTGTSAIAGFGVDVLNLGGADLIGLLGPTVIAPWAAGFGSNGIIVGADVVETSGGQLANLFGFLNPNINMSNPIMLFSIDVTTQVGTTGWITYAPGNPNPNGGLSYYVISTDGASVIAPNDPGTTLTFAGIETLVIPAPATLVLLALGGLCASRRR